MKGEGEMTELIREFEQYQDTEREALRAIRSHRNRRANWRHTIAVRKAKGIIFGLGLIALSVALILLDEMHDATQALILIPAGIIMMQKGV